MAGGGALFLGVCARAPTPPSSPSPPSQLVAFHVMQNKVIPEYVSGPEIQESLLPGAKVKVARNSVSPASYETASTPTAPAFYTAGKGTIVPIDGVLVPSARDLQASI